MDLAQFILKKMPTDLSEIEKARYLYIELARRVTFSTTFQNTDAKTFFKMYKATVDVRHLENFQVNCVMWAQLYSQLLNITGIKNSIINAGHQYVEFYIDDRKMIADATEGTYTDLSRIRNYDHTKYFGPSIFQRSDSKNNAIDFTQDWMKELHGIDKKIGYHCDKGKKLKDLKTLLVQIRESSLDLKEIFPYGKITKEEELCFKLEFLYETIGIMSDGYYESKDFVKYLQDMLLNEEEKKQIGSVELKRTNGDGKVDIIQCIYVQFLDDFKYYLLTPNLPIQQFNKSQIQSLAVKGYGIDKKKLPGVSFPRKFIAGKINKNLIYKLYRKLLFRNKQDKIDLYADQEKRHR